MQRCAAPPVIALFGALGCSILCSADARADGFRVNWAAMASARYSRFRLTAKAINWVTIGATSQLTNHTTNTRMYTGPSLFDREPPDVWNMMRRRPCDIMATTPTSVASNVMSRTSKFLMWPISWAMTA